MVPKIRTIHKLKPYLLQIIVLILICITIIIESVHFYIMEYLAGLYNDPSLHPFFAGLFFDFLKVLLLLVAFIGLVVIAFIGLVVNLFKKFKIYKNIGINFLLLGLSLGVFIGNRYVRMPGPPGATVFLRGFDKWVRKNVETAAIQEWLATIDDRYFSKDYYADTGSPNEFPKFIIDLNPKFISFGYSELDNTKIAKLSWGSGLLGEWGVIIGNSNMEMPKPGVEKISDSYWEYRRIIRPGVYIYDGG